uniref:Uncharacterized protein n=1 Tax=Magallana gigas TaxID=29159 RepID=K1RBK1_MAGGI
MDISNIRRVGIFAITDIEIGDELQYSYNKGKNDLLLEKEEQTCQSPLLESSEEEGDDDKDSVSLSWTPPLTRNPQRRVSSLRKQWLI